MSPQTVEPEVDLDGAADRAGAATPLSQTHLVVIPSYNTGEVLFESVAAARAHWAPVWVVFDGSTDGTEARLRRERGADPHLRILSSQRNCGKGAAVLRAVELARSEGYTHVLTMDADGQHPADLIPCFMAASAKAPEDMILGLPHFDANAPRARVHGRKLSNVLANVETGWAGIGDSLFGFRVYPVEALWSVMRHALWMRGFDFDPEAAVRLCWYGCRPVNVAAPVRYLSRAEGGVSHFNYVRDNLLLAWMHLRLVLELPLRLPALIWRRWSGGGAARPR